MRVESVRNPWIAGRIGGQHRKVHFQRATRRGLAVAGYGHFREFAGGNVKAVEQNAFLSVQAVLAVVTAQFPAPLAAPAFGGNPESLAAFGGGDARPRLAFGRT